MPRAAQAVALFFARLSPARTQYRRRRRAMRLSRCQRRPATQKVGHRPTFGDDMGDVVAIDIINRAVAQNRAEACEKIERRPQPVRQSSVAPISG